VTHCLFPVSGLSTDLHHQCYGPCSVENTVGNGSQSVFLKSSGSYIPLKKSHGHKEADNIWQTQLTVPSLPCACPPPSQLPPEQFPAKSLSPQKQEALTASTCSHDSKQHPVLWLSQEELELICQLRQSSLKVRNCNCTSLFLFLGSRQIPHHWIYLFFWFVDRLWDHSVFCFSVHQLAIWSLVFIQKSTPIYPGSPMLMEPNIYQYLYFWLLTLHIMCTNFPYRKVCRMSPPCGKTSFAVGNPQEKVQRMQDAACSMQGQTPTPQANSRTHPSTQQMIHLQCMDKLAPRFWWAQSLLVNYLDR
jgi:hypothetical protein